MRGRRGRCRAPSTRGSARRAGSPRWRRRHRRLRRFDRLGLRDAIFFGQDWGGLIGLRLVAAQPERSPASSSPTPACRPANRPPNEAFLEWQRFASTTETFPVGAIIGGGCTTELTPDVVAAYDAPFPDDSYMAGPRRMPSLVPTSPEDPSHDANVAAWDVLRIYDRPLLCAFSDGDPITKGGERQFLVVPGAEGQTPHDDRRRGALLQEDRGPDVAQVIVDLAARPP